MGTTSPTAKLDVAGEVKFGNTSTTCNATNEGQQRYNSTSKNMEFCNGTAWTAFGSAGPRFQTITATYTGDSGGQLVACPVGYTLIFQALISTDTLGNPRATIDCSGDGTNLSIFLYSPGLEPITATCMGLCAKD